MRLFACLLLLCALRLLPGVPLVAQASMQPFPQLNAPQLSPPLPASYVSGPLSARGTRDTRHITVGDDASLERYALWGALLGASAGVVSGLWVRVQCGDLCDGTTAQGLALHVGTGALLGAAAGTLVHWLRSD